ncbi:MAG TPA: lamin tail domain-containing protein [Candidatus Cloacimonadota bacterium]|nr:lamin tail domain-containing protein [Candidatus Cloacimonadota bacterium]
MIERKYRKIAGWETHATNIFIRKAIVLIFCLFTACLLRANVVINEIMYDPAGNDTGNEWLELYNNGQQDEDLEGAHLQVAGQSFINIYTFPHFILRAGRFLLIGEQNIIQAQLFANLNMTDGDNATAGVRYVSPNGIYTDTVLYGNPNTYSLIDDQHNTAAFFAPDAEAGCSLARIADGYDSDNCATDFIAEANPTPGSANHIVFDYGLENTTVTIINGFYRLETDIRNHSGADSDTLTISLEVSLNDNLLQLFDIQPLPPAGSVHFSAPLSLPQNSEGTLKIDLILFNDFNPADNSWTMNLGAIQQLGLKINEIMYNPGSDNQEWVEVYIPSQNYSQRQYTLIDLAGNTTSFSLPAFCPQYIVLCKNKVNLLNKYPDCPGPSIIQTSTLPPLNNEGDVLVLKDDAGSVIDSVSYIGITDKKDISLERHVSSEGVVTWHYCYSTIGGTPGQVNSEPPPPSELEQGHIKIVGNPFNPQLGEKMSLQYNFKDQTNYLSCTVFDLSGNRKHIIASVKKIGNVGEITWDGCDNHGKPFPRGIYVLLVEVKNSSGHYFLRKQMTVMLATK